MRRRGTAIALAIVFTAALALRLIGIRYGLPAVYNPDEVAIMSRALAFGTGDPNPHNFLYPTFYFYALFGWIGASFVAGLLTGAYESLGAFRDLFFVDQTNVYLAGRMLSVVCGVVGVGATWLLGRRVGGGTTGAAAAAFLAVSPFHVRDSHYVKHDVSVTLAIVLAYLAICRVWPGWGSAAGHDGGRPDRTTHVPAAAAAVGVAFSTHYYTLFMALPLACAIWQRERGNGTRAVIRRLALAAGVAAATFLLLSPFILVEPATAWRDVVANRQIVMDRAVSSGGLFASAPAYLRMLAGDAMGWPVALLALGGVIALTTRAPQFAALMLAFPVAFLLFISNTVAATRYLNPVLPAVAILAGYAVAAGTAGLRHGAARVAAATSIVVLAAAPGVLASIATGLFFRQDDTRTLAGRYIETHVPAGATLLVQPYSVELAQSRESLREALTAHLGDPGRASIKFQLRLSARPSPSPAYRTIYLGTGGLDVDKIYVAYDELGGDRRLRALERLGVEYVVVKRYNRPDPETLPFLDALAREGRRIAVFSPYRPSATPEVAATVEPFLHNTDARIDEALERPGPLIEIWHLQ